MCYGLFSFCSFLLFFVLVLLHSSFSLEKKKKQKVQGKSKCSAAFAKASAQEEQSLLVGIANIIESFRRDMLKRLKALYFSLVFFTEERPINIGEK